MRQILWTTGTLQKDIQWQDKGFPQLTPQREDLNIWIKGALVLLEVILYISIFKRTYTLNASCISDIQVLVVGLYLFI